MASPVQQTLFNHLAGLQAQLGSQPVLTAAMTQLQGLPERNGWIGSTILHHPEDHYDRIARNIVIDCKMKLGRMAVENCADALTVRKFGERKLKDESDAQVLSLADKLEDTYGAVLANKVEPDPLTKACKYYLGANMMQQARRRLFERELHGDPKAVRILASFLDKESAFLGFSQSAFSEAAWAMAKGALDCQEGEYLMTNEAYIDVAADSFWRLKEIEEQTRQFDQQDRKVSPTLHKCRIAMKILRMMSLVPYCEDRYRKLSKPLLEKKRPALVERYVTLETKARLLEQARTE